VTAVGFISRPVRILIQTAAEGKKVTANFPEFCFGRRLP
jgi:hypothetical protein